MIQGIMNKIIKYMLLSQINKDRDKIMRDYIRDYYRYNNLNRQKCEIIAVNNMRIKTYYIPNVFLITYVVLVMVLPFLDLDIGSFFTLFTLTTILFYRTGKKIRIMMNEIVNDYKQKTNAKFIDKIILPNEQYRKSFFIRFIEKQYSFDKMKLHSGDYAYYGLLASYPFDLINSDGIISYLN